MAVHQHALTRMCLTLYKCSYAGVSTRTRCINSRCVVCCAAVTQSKSSLWGFNPWEPINNISSRWNNGLFGLSTMLVASDVLQCEPYHWQQIKTSFQQSGQKPLPLLSLWAILKNVCLSVNFLLSVRKQFDFLTLFNLHKYSKLAEPPPGKFADPHSQACA